MTKQAMLKLTLCTVLAWVALAAGVRAQIATGEVHGTVTDPSGALVPSAAVVLTGAAGTQKTTTSGRDGAFRIQGIAPGTYRLDIAANGFAPSTVDNIAVKAGRPVLENVTLEIAVAEQQVEVTDQSASINTAADNNASSVVIKGNDLNALSDDPDQLQSELTALAGPAAGPNGAQIFIDGFSGGNLPPKSSIREIRVNQNPFGAQYDQLGYGRIEILTKPGTDKMHGNMMVMGNDSSFNSLNPFVTQEPAYHTLFAMGSVGGSLGSKISWNGSLFDRNNASNSIVTAVSDATTNAELLALYPGLNCTAASAAGAYNCSEAVATPQSRLDISPRFDFQLGAKNTLTVRYMLDRQTQTNSGVSGASLPSQGYNSSGYGNSIQLSDSQVLSETAVNETRFQFNRNTNSQAPYSLAPSIMIQGGFSEGGNGQGATSDHSELFELENYTTIAARKHAIELGGRYRLNRDANESTAGFNGAYIYTSLAAYEASTPSQYTVTVGNANALFKAYDIGVFYQDDYKSSPNLTLSYGLRYEMQNWIGDHNDWAPRFSLAWAPGGAKSKTVIRAGYGWFYSRFGTGNVGPGGPAAAAPSSRPSARTASTSSSTWSTPPGFTRVPRMSRPRASSRA